jgi:E3 ubiquitin-protein ligase MYCBP2
MEEGHVRNPMSEYFQDPVKFAREKLVFYMCRVCKRPFYGGHDECREALEMDENAYVCARCSRVFEKTCPKHKDAAMLFKCFWCCRPALFFCWGTTHFCESCHKRPLDVVKPPWPECDRHCQFHPHCPNGTREIVGYCTLCEDERLKQSLDRR